MELNSQLPYPLAKKEEDTYFFKTSSGVEYTAYFIEFHRFSNTNILYNFSFDVIGKTANYYERISTTITQILKDFFVSNENSMIFVCDTSDNQESARLRLFERWFRHSKSDDYLLKLDRSEPQPNYNLFASLIIRKENTMIEAVVNLFDQYINDLKY